MTLTLDIYPGGRERQMGTAVEHHMAHLLTGGIAVNQIDGMMVIKLDPVFVQFLRHRCQIIMEHGEKGHVIPAEMGAENDGRRHIRLGKALCPGLDLIHIVMIRPV